MANNFDGSLKFNTKLDNTEFKRGAQELEQEVKSTAKRVNAAGKSVSDGFGSIDTSKSRKALSDLGKEADKTASKVSDISKQKIKVNDTKDSQGFEKGSSRMQSAMAGLKNRVSQFGADIKNAIGAAFVSNAPTVNSVSQLKDMLKEMGGTVGQVFKSDNITEFGKALGDLEAQMHKFGKTKFMSDGQIFNGADIENDFTEIQNVVKEGREKLQEELEKLTPSERLEAEAELTQQAVQRFGEAVQSIQDVKNPQDAWAIVENLKDQMESYESTPFAKLDVSQDMARVIDEVTEALSQAQEEWDQTHFDVSPFERGFQSLSEKIRGIPTLTQLITSGVSGASNALAGMAGKFAAIGYSINQGLHDPLGAINKTLGFVASSAGKAVNGLVGLAKTAAGAVAGSVKKLAINAKEAAVNLAKMVPNMAISGLKKLGGVIFGTSNTAAQMGNSFKLTFGTIAKYALGLMGIKSVFNGLKQVITDGISQFAAGDSQLQGNINSLKTALANLKLSFGAAFAPIASIVLPYITAMVNALATAVSYVGMFIAALTGKSTYKKAVANVNNVAGAADNAAESAKEAKRQLAGFDKLEILSAKDGGNGGGGGGGGGAGGPSFEDVAIDSGIADWAQKLKDMFAAGDYEGIGKVIADGINAAFAKVDELIKWDTVGETVTKYVDAFCRIFNSMVDNINWDLIGRTFGDGIDTILHTMDLLLTGINWGQLGTKISVGLNGLVDQIEWDLLGKTIADYFGARVLLFGKAVEDFNWPLLGSRIATGINSFVTTITKHIDGINWGKIGTKFATGANNLVSGIKWDEIGKSAAKGINHITDMLYNAVTTFNWEELGSSIATSINNFFKDVDFAKLGKTVSEGIKGILTTLGTALGEIDWDQVARDVNDFLSNVDWVGILAGLADVIINALSGIAIVGLSVALGILDGIKNGFTNIGGWVKTNILDPFITGFKNAFGIHSPASAPALVEAAGNVASGILEGIAGGFKNLAGWAQEHILGPLSDALHGAKVGVQVVLEKVGEWAGEAWDFIQRGKETIVKTVKTTIKKISNKAGKAWEFIKSGAGEIKKNVKTTIKKVTNKAGEAWEFVKTGAGDIKKNVKTTLKKVTNNAGEAWEFIKSGAKDIKKTIETTLKKTGDWAGSVWKSFLKGKETVEKTVETLLKKTGDWAGEAWSTFKKGKEGVTKTVSIAVSKAKTWVSDAWNALTSKDKTSTVKTAVSKAKQWGADAWKALSRGGETHTSTVQSAVKKKNGAWSDSAYKAATLNDKTITRTIKVKVKLSEKDKKTLQGAERSGGYTKALGGVYTHGHWSNLPQYASGGVISARRFARNIPQYAAGGTPHGTAFIAGERGPEVVGHIGGRTEVLNKSQLASTMYSAVVNGMGEIGGRIGSAIVSKIAESSNAQVAAINAISTQIAYTAPLMATGTVVPYSITKADLTELGRTFEASNEELQYTLVQAIASAANLIVAAIQDIDTTTTIDQNMITRRTIEDINRRTLMFQASPLK